MSTQSAKEQPKDYEIDCELLPAAVFNVAAAFDPKELKGVPVGGFSLNETDLLETTVFDSSDSPARPTGRVKKLTKAGLFKELASATSLSHKQVAEVFDALTNLIRKELGTKGPGEFTLPGLLKLELERKPASKVGKRPRNVVKPRPLKGLQEMVE